LPSGRPSAALGSSSLPPGIHDLAPGKPSELPKVRAASLSDRDEPLWQGVNVQGECLFPSLWITSHVRQLVPVPEAAHLMRKTEEEVRRLAELGLLHARRDVGELRVEPAIMN
jgi:hypothetical protein